jgi:hypothetical protein
VGRRGPRRLSNGPPIDLVFAWTAMGDLVETARRLASLVTRNRGIGRRISFHKNPTVGGRRHASQRPPMQSSIASRSRCVDPDARKQHGSAASQVGLWAWRNGTFGPVSPLVTPVGCKVHHHIEVQDTDNLRNSHTARLRSCGEIRHRQPMPVNEVPRVGLSKRAIHPLYNSYIAPSP